MQYTVKYKLLGQWFWRKVKGVKGDGFLSETNARFLILSDETRIEIPVTSTFRFSPNRFRLTEQQISREAGQPVAGWKA